MNPVVLEPNRPRRFYRAGGASAEFRGAPRPDEYQPEEWIASTTIARPSESTEGLTRLPDGRWLRLAVAADPRSWLGPDHVARFGDDVALLVKLLDVGERLPVHVHPTRPFARAHLGSLHGKTEAWVVLGASGAEPSVWLGFRHDHDPRELQAWVTGQDRDALLGALNHLPVREGDAIVVPAGTPHAIGPGVFCLELQEPTDFSINLEWEGFDIPDASDGQLGLTPDQVLGCVERRALGPTDLNRLRTPVESSAGPATDLLPAGAEFFRATRLRPAPVADLEAALAVLVVVDGAGLLHTEAGATLELRRGQVVLVPWAAGPGRLDGDIDVVRCQPPAADDRSERNESHHG